MRYECRSLMPRAPIDELKNDGYFCCIIGTLHRNIKEATSQHDLFSVIFSEFFCFLFVSTGMFHTYLSPIFLSGSVERA